MNSSPKNSDSTDLEAINNLLNLLLDSNSATQQETTEADIGPQTQSKIDPESDLQELETSKNASFEDLDVSHSPSQDIDIEVKVENLESPFLQNAVEYEELSQHKLDSKEQYLALEAEEIDSLLGNTPAFVDHKPRSGEFQVDSREKDSHHLDNSLEVQAAPQNSEPGKDKDVIEAVNTLIPLVVELLKYKIDDSQNSIVRAVTPVLDRIIEERSLEDSTKMATAIAKILPHAITQGVHLTPEAIAKAIAPELALCIKEQILLDENAISEALGSEMGKAIKSQIELEKDAMVDALYPVIGSTIAKYMVEVVQNINSKVENTLSPEGIKRKVQARLQGISEAELIFRESVGYYVQAVFLIDKDSGIVIQEIKRAEDQHLDSDMIAGMLTAIRSFAHDCIASGSELDEIDYGDCQIPIEVAGYCYLAVVVKGEPSKEFRSKIRRVLGKIVLKYGKAIAAYQGDMSTVPIQVKSMLEELIEEKTKLPKSPKSSFSPTLLGLLGLILGMILIPWGIFSYQANRAQNIEQIAASRLDAAPELSVYRLEPYVHRGIITISGRVPSKYLQNQAATITQQIANQNNLQLDNQIVAIKIPPNPNLVNGEIQRLTHLLNQQPKTSIQTEYNFQTQTLVIRGFVLDLSRQESMAQMFNQVPGIEKIILNIKTQLPQLKEHIQFNSGSSQFDFADSSSKIDSVIQFLHQYPQLHVQLIAHNDSKGSIGTNQKLAKKRCQNVRAVLVDKGVDSVRIVDHCEKLDTFSVQDRQATWLNRYVSFEPIIPTNIPTNIPLKGHSKISKIK